MSNLEAWLIIILVIGVIASNIAVLKYSAKFKMPQFGKDDLQQPKAKKDDNSDPESKERQSELDSDSNTKTKKD
ncbi:DUF2897 family protein [Shewanella psychrotolerans]|uniref:DUF2897 family protein n=1 Tax=Shewanella psychrotolerans TaxID=2864206 RepID=UPI001C65DC06|nr:DUF2897 family protein [Shewanella psychrotolerans]QYJ99868.1 DUF2897 family protein [Shewanella psychrotolerans]